MHTTAILRVRAADCGISQPAFSARIRNLETTLGVSIVQRGNRFLGFTSEGERVVCWAHWILADLEGMRQELAQAKGTLAGKLTIGCVPTTLSFASAISGSLRASFPDLVILIRSASSNTIRADLETMAMDVGITYLDVAFPKHMETRALYEERYVLLAPPGLSPRKTGTATWAEAADLPLCLLSPEMHNRQIVDAIFADQGLAPQPVIETNAFSAALAQVAGGGAATIAPERLATDQLESGRAVRLALNEPDVTKPIGLVSLDRQPELPAVEALVRLIDATGVDHL